MTFKYHSSYEGQPETRVEHSTNAVTLPEILEQFEEFLLGSGFKFEGKIDVVDDLKEGDDEEVVEPTINWKEVANDRYLEIVTKNVRLEDFTKEIKHQREQLDEKDKEIEQLKAELHFANEGLNAEKRRSENEINGLKAELSGVKKDSEDERRHSSSLLEALRHKEVQLDRAVTLLKKSLGQNWSTSLMWVARDAQRLIMEAEAK